MAHEVVLRLSAPLRQVAIANSPTHLASGQPNPTYLSPEETRIQWEAQQKSLIGEQGGRIDKAIESITAAVKAIEGREIKRLAEMERATIELSIAIAERLLREAVGAGKFAIEKAAQELVEKLTPTGPVRVSLHPDDLDLMRARSPENSSWHSKEIHWMADPSLPRGGCRAESGEVSVTAELEKQLQAIGEKLRESLVHAAS